MSKYKLIIILSIFTFQSCSDFFDINNNPNDPTASPLSNLLTSSEKNIADGLAIGNGIGNDLATYVHQMSTREESDQYSVNGNEYYLNQTWTTFFREALVDLDVIIEQGTANNNLTYVGVAKILKAYSFSQLVDVFGDVPFSEFNKFKLTTSPKFDDDSDIYSQLLAMIDEGIIDINSDLSVALLKPSKDDLIYGGDKLKWTKAANTLKLKLLTQIRLVRDVKSEVASLLSDPSKLINNVSESFMFAYGPLGSTDDRHPGFSDYTATQRTNHISPWFYEILRGYNKFIYNGISDPRLPYYVYNQLTPSGASPNVTEYRDGGFISIYFGSVGPNRDASQQNAISLFGIYPVGGRYDDGSGGTANAASGTGAAPYRFITYADRLYLEAELIQQGLVAGDVNTVFAKAVEASFSQIDYVVGNFVKPTQSVPKLIGSTAVNDYITAVNSLFSASSNSKKLEYIMTQKWLSNVGTTVDQYSDLRRTGYPLIFDPKNPEMAPNGFVSSNAPNSTIKVPVQLSNKFPFSLPWPTTELEKNRNAPQQKDPASYKVFWQN